MGCLRHVKSSWVGVLERYAKLPHPPELLKLEEVPSFWTGVGWGLLLFPIAVLPAWVALLFVTAFIGIIFPIIFPVLKELHVTRIVLAVVLAFVLSVRSCTRDHFKVKAANGNKPWENARRQKANEEAMAVALKAAEPVKAAQDHRLRCQIRELEGLAKTVAEKEAEVCRILAKL